MDDFSFDQGREATAVEDPSTAIDGAESLLNELSGVFDFDDPGPPTPPKPPATIKSDDEPAAEAAVTPEGALVASPPRIEPPAIIWKPARRRFRLRLR